MRYLNPEARGQISGACPGNEKGREGDTVGGSGFPISLNASRPARSAREPGWGPPLAPIPSAKVFAYIRFWCKYVL